MPLSGPNNEESKMKGIWRASMIGPTIRRRKKDKKNYEYAEKKEYEIIKRSKEKGARSTH